MMVSFHSLVHKEQTMEDWSDRLALISGFILFLMTMPHYMMGWPAVLEGLEAIAASQALIDNIHIIWIWSSLTMMGLAVLLMTVALKKQEDQQLIFLIYLIIGGLLLLFSLIGLVITWPDPHLSIFLIPALLASIAAYFKKTTSN